MLLIYLFSTIDYRQQYLTIDQLIPYYCLWTTISYYWSTHSIILLMDNNILLLIYLFNTIAYQTTISYYWSTYSILLLMDNNILLLIYFSTIAYRQQYLTIDLLIPYYCLSDNNILLLINLFQYYCLWTTISYYWSIYSSTIAYGQQYLPIDLLTQY